MKYPRESVTDFMERYFAAYSTIAQDPAKNHQMVEYYSPDLIVNAYLGEVLEVDFEGFLLLSSSHPNIRETLTADHFVIDEEKGMIAVLVRGVLTSLATGEVIREMRFSAHYQLKLDEKELIKIEQLWLFSQYAPEGKKSIFEMYEEERIAKMKAEEDTV